MLGTFSVARTVEVNFCGLIGGPIIGGPFHYKFQLLSGIVLEYALKLFPVRSWSCLPIGLP